MNTSTMSLAAVAVLAFPGCILVGHNGVDPGEPLNARLLLTWDLEEESSGKALSCNQAGADTVRVTSRNSNTAAVTVDLFDCVADTGTTFPLTAGDYFIRVELVDCLGAESCANAVVVSEVARIGPYAVWENETFDLGHFVFLVK